MPDLDELLTEDAGRFQAAEEPAFAFGPAFERALGVAARRRVRNVGITAVAVAAVAAGAVFALTASSDDARPHVRLAAYDQVLGPVPNDEGSVYVIGPKDEHTAACELMPNMSATRVPSPTVTPRAACTSPWARCRACSSLLRCSGRSPARSTDRPRCSCSSARRIDRGRHGRLRDENLSRSASLHRNHLIDAGERVAQQQQQTLVSPAERTGKARQLDLDPVGEADRS